MELKTNCASRSCPMFVSCACRRLQEDIAVAMLMKMATYRAGRKDAKHAKVQSGVVWCGRVGWEGVTVLADVVLCSCLSSFRTALPLWGRITWNMSKICFSVQVQYSKGYTRLGGKTVKTEIIYTWYAMTKTIFINDIYVTLVAR